MSLSPEAARVLSASLQAELERVGREVAEIEAVGGAIAFAATE